MSNTQLRKAELSDCELFYQVRNNPQNRNQSLNSLDISWEDHQTWFGQKLLSPKNHYYTILFSGTPVGYVRLDPNPQLENVVSIALLPKFQGKKIGQEALHLLTKLAQRDNLCPLLATVKKENPGSARIFHAAGFLPKKEVENSLVYFEFTGG